MSLVQQARHLIQKYHVFPKKRWGQHFLTNSDLLNLMISYAEVNDQDVVLEVGPGLGFLTQLLSQRCKKVVSVEVDSRLIQLLRERFQGVNNIELIEGDILKVDVPPFNKFVSTPPYSISSHLLFWLLGKPFDSAVLTFQKEFAKRMAATINTKEYGRLTVTTYYRADVELMDFVPKTSFYPPPDVDSMIIRLKLRHTPPFRVKDEEVFLDLVRTAFTQRNKKLRNSVILFLRRKGMVKAEALQIADSVRFHDKRVRELAPEDFGVLTNEIIDKTSILR